MSAADRQAIIEDLTHGRLTEAEAAARRFLQGNDSIEALYLMAAIRSAQGEHRVALQLFSGAAQLMPQRADVAFNFGVALRQANRMSEALNEWRRAVQLEPDHVDAWRNLALGLDETGDDQGAFEAFARLLELRPQDEAAILLEMGNLRFHQFDLDGAASFYAQLIAHFPKSVNGWTNLGEAMKAGGRSEEAEFCLRRAVSIDAGFAHAHFNLGCLLLSEGRWAEGFTEYEWRSNRLRVPPSLAALPAWTGDEPPGTRVALWNDQGYGDGMHFLRFAAGVAAKGHRITLVIGPELRRLFASVPWAEAVVPLDGPLPPLDAHLPLASLPHHLGISGPEGWWPGSYLSAPQPLTPVLPRRTGGSGGNLVVGLVWAGTGGYAKDHLRSLSLGELAPALTVPGIDWYSLQLGEVAGERNAPPWRERICDLGPELGDFADTAALISQLDLVLTVDTSVAHLAGALGKPVWVMLRKWGDWRWLTAGERTAWYPSMRLFRQTAGGDWSGMVQAVSRALLERTRQAVA